MNERDDVLENKETKENTNDDIGAKPVEDVLKEDNLP